MVPCGRCQACRVNKTKEWSIRLLHESEYWPIALFLTLTYDEEHKPENNTLVKRDLQLFYKRLRKSLQDKRILHYSVGEYGEEGDRPHYHAIIFGLSVDDGDLVRKTWPYGFSCLKPYIGLATGNYVAGYIQKKLYGKQADTYVLKGVTPPFLLCSQKLGLRWCMDNRDKLLKDMCIYINGLPHSIPRYYRKKLGIEAETIQELRKDFKRKIQITHLHRLSHWDMQRFLDSKVNYTAVTKCLDGELTDVGEDRLLDALTSWSINESRKQAERQTLQRIKMIKRGSL